MASIQTGHKTGFDAANTTAVTVTKPDTSPSGDMILIAIMSDLNANNFTFDGSFAELFADEAFQSVATAGVAYKTSGGAEANYTVTVTSERQAWICLSVNSHDGIDGTPPVRNTGSGTTATFPAFTPSVAGCLGIRILANDNVATTLPYGAMSDGTWTKLDEVGGASAGAIGLWYKALPDTSEQAAATSVMAVTEQWWAASFAIKPAAAAGTKAPVFRPKILRVWTINR